MPNRVIREGLLDSAKINKLSDKEQMFFVRLMLVVDDYGRFDARPELLKSKCYPVTDKRLTDVSNMLTVLKDVKLIELYSVNGKNYLEIIEYNQRLRQKREKFPSPNMADDSNVLTIDSNVRPESNPIQSESEKKPNPKRTPFWIAMDDFREMRKKIKKPLTANAENLIIKKLNDLEPNNEINQIKILENSTMNSWQGVFELKNIGNEDKWEKQKEDFING